MLPTTEGHLSVQKNGRVSTNWKPAVSTADRTAEWRSGNTVKASVAGTTHCDASERFSCRHAIGSSPTYGVSWRYTIRLLGPDISRNPSTVPRDHSVSVSESQTTWSLWLDTMTSGFSCRTRS